MESLKKAFLQISDELQNGSEIHLITDPSYLQEQEQSLLPQLLSKYSKDLSPYDADRLTSEFLYFGPLQKIITDESITEIIINSPREIWYERHGELRKHEDHFFSDLSYANFIHRICQKANVTLNLEAPCANGSWQNFRLHLINPPLVPEYTQLCLRRHPKNPWCLSQLLKTGWAPEIAINTLKSLITKKQNILIIGPTGSGKTSVLNAFLQHLPINERVVTIEDTSELTLPNHASTKLLTRSDPNNLLKKFNQTDLIIESLRMRPERIIMGELRGGEAKDYILALSTGHKGSLSTLHAGDPQQALWRLEVLVQIGAPQWSIDAIRGLIKLGLDYIVQTELIESKRQLRGIYKITSLEKFGFLIDPIYQLDK